MCAAVAVGDRWGEERPTLPSCAVALTMSRWVCVLQVFWAPRDWGGGTEPACEAMHVGEQPQPVTWSACEHVFGEHLNSAWCSAHESAVV